MLKYTGRIGCSALTDSKMFLRYICPKVLDHSVTLLYTDISLKINGSFIVARAFYTHVMSSSGQNVYEDIRK